MKCLIVAALALLAIPVVAQQQPAQQEPGKKPVAVVNGEVITQEQFDRMYNSLSMPVRSQYEKNGGREAFLQNYLLKRLIVQEAVKKGFDKRTDVKAAVELARESALFDRYVRDVVAQPVVTEAEIRKFYEDHADNFTHLESVKARHIVIMTNGAGPKPHTKEQALQIIQQIHTDLRSKSIPPPGTDPEAAQRTTLAYFAQAAQQYSEDGTAPNGGEIGWVDRSQGLDSAFADAAFTMKKGTLSGIIETKAGYDLIFVEDKKPAWRESYQDVRPSIREHLLAQHQADVMNLVGKLGGDLQASGKISVYPENLK